MVKIEGFSLSGIHRVPKLSFFTIGHSQHARS
jgi:hypothetical protein